MKTRKITMARGIVEFLAAQHIADDSHPSGRKTEPLFAGVFAIFGHGNVTCLGEALYAARDRLPTWRGQNEQGMALACAGFAKAKRRRQIMVATSSIGPGAANMITASALAHVNRLPMLLLSGDAFLNRRPDPVLQQAENFGDPTATVNDAFKPVTRYWDRISHPAQLLTSLPQAVATMLDPGDCGPAFLALPQDVQAVAYPYPESFFAPRVHRIARPRPDAVALSEAAAVLKTAKRPLIVAGGGVHYSLACGELAAFARARRIPVCETVAGRSALARDDEWNAGPVGVIGASSANDLAARADVVLAVGTRLQDFTTGSGTVFGSGAKMISINAARHDALKRDSVAVVGDAKVCLLELQRALGSRWKSDAAWVARAGRVRGKWNRFADSRTAAPRRKGGTEGKGGTPPTYAQVVGAVNRAAKPGDLALTAAGGLPGELNKVWKSRVPGDYDCEFGFSCMGYEIAGAVGAKMANPKREVFALVGDGSYLMMNSDILTSVMTGRKLIVVVCDNGGYAVIDRLQRGKGGASFNNMLRDCRGDGGREVDFVLHAKSMGAKGEWAESVGDLEGALVRARRARGTYVVGVRVAEQDWTGGDAWWDVAVPEESGRGGVRRARGEYARGLRGRDGG